MEENINLLGIDLLSGIDNKIIDIDTKDVSLFSPLILAYIGDAVYELIIRTHIVIKGNRPVNKLHKDSASLVKAKTQASFGKLLKIRNYLYIKGEEMLKVILWLKILLFQIIDMQQPLRL